jgi:hypothetical protein
LRFLEQDQSIIVFISTCLICSLVCPIYSADLDVLIDSKVVSLPLPFPKRIEQSKSGTDGGIVYSLYHHERLLFTTLADFASTF